MHKVPEIFEGVGRPDVVSFSSFGSCSMGELLPLPLSVVNGTKVGGGIMHGFTVRGNSEKVL
jgi:hypothetical protein